MLLFISLVSVTNPWETLYYEVVGAKVIEPTDLTSIFIQEGKDMLTLLTCHPYQIGGGPYRYLLFCERVTDANMIQQAKVDMKQKKKRSLFPKRQEKIASTQVSFGDVNLSSKGKTYLTNKEEESSKDSSMTSGQGGVNMASNEKPTDDDVTIKRQTVTDEKPVDTTTIKESNSTVSKKEKEESFFAMQGVNTLTLERAVRIWFPIVVFVCFLVCLFRIRFFSKRKKDRFL